MTGTVSLAENEVDVREEDGFATVTFRRTGDASGAVNILYEVIGDSATAGDDFEPIEGVVTIEAGENEATIEVPIVNDTEGEETEVAVVSLLSIDSGFLSAPRTTRVNILDDENPVVLPPELPLESDYDITEVPVLAAPRVSLPLDMRFLPGSDSQMLVAQQNGLVRLYDVETGGRTTVLDIRDQVNSNAGGLMNIELHPDFPEQPFIYAYYSVDPPDTEGRTGNAGPDGAGNRFQYLARFTYDPETNTADPDSRVILVGGAAQSLDDISGGGELDFSEGEAFRDLPGSDEINLSDEEIALGLTRRQDLIKGDSPHIGGGMAFGPDGALYLSIGDGVAFNYADPRAFSVQDTNALNGKVLRIDPITGEGLADNPFVESGDSLDLNRSKVYAYGLRNPFSLSFTSDGRMIVADTGQSSYEELNIIEAGGNYGWPFYEGADADRLFTPPNFRPTEENGFQDEWDAFLDSGIEVVTPFRGFAHASREPGFQFQAITGGEVDYDGDVYPASLRNHYFFSDFSQGEVYAVDLDEPTDVKFLYSKEGAVAPVFFTQGPDGRIWYANVLTAEIGYLEIEELPLEFDEEITGDRTAETLSGGPENDLISGRRGQDLLEGRRGDDGLLGGRGDDRLHGGAGDDLLLGGRGSDVMQGNEGEDTFIFRTRHLATGPDRDLIRFFASGEDLIDLSRVDGDVTEDGRQALSFVNGGFSGTPGEVRLEDAIIEGDVDGDMLADFEVEVEGVTSLEAEDFVL